MHPQLDPLCGTPGDGQMFYAVTELLGVLQIFLGHLGNALGVDPVECQRFAECDGGQDGQLVGRIDTLHVEARIGLRIAQTLGLRQHLVEATALVAHLGEYEIAGAVDDAGNPFDAVAGQALANRLDDGNASRHRRLECHHHALATSRVEDLVAVQRDERLIGGDHVLSLVDSMQGQFAGDIGSAEKLHNDAHFPVVHHFHGLVGELDALQGADPRLVQIPNAGMHDLDCATRTARDFLAIAGQNVHGAAAHGAEP